MSTSGSSTPILFLHGAWHGSWCWAEVLARVTGAGARALAVDMAGHGLRAWHPAALTRRPFDASLLASEPSPVADVGLDQAGELLVSQIEQLGAGDPVIVVAHSAGGAVLTRAAQQATALVAHAVYLTAFMPASGVPISAYTRMPEHEGSLVRPLAVADPAAVGALRLDVASPDPRYRQRLREAFYGDVDRAVADAAIALLTPDAPAGISVGTTTLTAARWGSVPRTYVICTQDMAIRPALQQRFIADADAAFPANPTSVHTLHASHSPVPVDACPGSRHRPRAPPLKGLTKHGGLRSCRPLPKLGATPRMSMGRPGQAARASAQIRPLGAAHAPIPTGRN